MCVSPKDVSEALSAWEGDQLALGMQLWKHGQALGEQSQFIYRTERWKGEQ